MRILPVAGRILRLALVALLAVAPAAEARAADPVQSEFLGSRYCRAKGRLSGTADLTLSDCRRRCDEELCDDWFWKERLPCWNRG
jgi:hypothetical protein